jgi:hypothetical protein
MDHLDAKELREELQSKPERALRQEFKETVGQILRGDGSIDTAHKLSIIETEIQNINQAHRNAEWLRKRHDPRNQDKLKKDWI